MGGVTGITSRGAASPSSFSIDVIEGRAPGYTYVEKFGRNPSIGTAGTPADVWNGGGLYTGHPTGTPEPIEGLSTDNVTDIGQTVRSWGLKTSDDTAQSFVDWTLNGTTPVLIDGGDPWYRIYRSEFLTGPANAGSITIRNTVTVANIFQVMPVGAAQTLIAAFTVPAGSKLMIESLWIGISRSGGLAGSANVVLARRRFGSGVFNHIRSWDLQTGGPMPPLPGLPIFIEERSDVVMRVADVSDNGTSVSAQFDGYVKRNAA